VCAMRPAGRARAGMPAAAFSGDLRIVDSRLADRHIPGAPKRNDTLAGPRMRRADLVRWQEPPM